MQQFDDSYEHVKTSRRNASRDDHREVFSTLQAGITAQMDGKE